MTEIKPVTLGIIAAIGLWWWYRGGGGTPDYSQGIWSAEQKMGGSRAPGGPTRAEIQTRVMTSGGPEIFGGSTPKQKTAYMPPMKPAGWSDLDWYDFTHGY
jgi:hypothetical protein